MRPEDAARIAAEADRLIAEHRFDEAEGLLRQSLEESPDSSTIVTALGMLFCYTQREADALALLERSSDPRASLRVGTALANHYACRVLMATKLGIDDELGQTLLQRVRNLGFEPEDVGIQLSACLIVKNEQKHLERCLASIRHHVDEIIVVDTGSSDDTLKIAEAHGAKIGHFVWCDDFAAARNASLDLATGHWALWIDADEEVTPESWKMIAEGLMRPQFGGYHVRIVNFMGDGSGNRQYVHNPVRLFRLHPNIRFTGRIHEQIKPAIDELGLQTATLEGVRLNHYGYADVDMEEKGKLHRTITLLERELEEAPNDSFQIFNLANAYRVAGDPERTIELARRCIATLKEHVSYGPVLFQLLAASLIDLGRYPEAIAACSQADALGYGGIINEFERAHALSRSERHPEALVAIERCLHMEWPPHLTGDYGIFTHKRHVLKGQILTCLGRLEEAIELFDYALGVDPSDTMAFYSKGIALQRLGRNQEAIEHLLPCIDVPGHERTARRHLALAQLGIGEAHSAEATLGELWRTDPANDWLFVDWISACEAVGDPGSVAAAYEEYARRRQPTPDMLVNWGRALAAQGQAGEALQRFADAIQQDPTNANALFNCGDLLAALGQAEDAARAYRAGLAIQPDHAPGWFVLGNALYRIGAVDAARAAYRRALHFQPDYPEATHNLALLEDEPAA